MLSSPTNIEMPWLVTSPKPPIPKAFPFGGTVRGRGTKSGASWSIPPDRGTGHSAQQPLPLPTWPRLRAPEPRLSVVRPTVGSDGPKGTRGPSEARTAHTVDVPNWPFTFQPLVRFHVLSLVDEPAEAIHHPPTRVPNTQQSPLPTRGHTCGINASQSGSQGGWPVGCRSKLAAPICSEDEGRIGLSPSTALDTYLTHGPSASPFLLLCPLKFIVSASVPFFFWHTTSARRPIPSRPVLTYIPPPLPCFSPTSSRVCNTS